MTRRVARTAGVLLFAPPACLAVLVAAAAAMALAHGWLEMRAAAQTAGLSALTALLGVPLALVVAPGPASALSSLIVCNECLRTIVAAPELTCWSTLAIARICTATQLFTPP